ncbi:hypothetical protein M413DRAFT_442477 [Hebeloma cylindrosporum]|uniref:Uncharacterized protein n=1 Tax=Hebeloma cylindrosporum TaxID=76867 RepID=A0A0C2YU03_HEBCY|nr:hypothetical protein M413DRAFT_442477 [Hebeloma cylindrosporum h7]
MGFQPIRQLPKLECQKYLTAEYVMQGGRCMGVGYLVCTDLANAIGRYGMKGLNQRLNDKVPGTWKTKGSARGCGPECLALI